MSICVMHDDAYNLGYHIEVVGTAGTSAFQEKIWYFQSLAKCTRFDIIETRLRK